MYFLCVLMILASITTAFHHNCLSDSEASFLVSSYTNLITNTQANFNLTLADQVLSPDYQSTSAAVDYVREEPVCRFSPLACHEHINNPTETNAFPMSVVTNHPT